MSLDFEKIPSPSYVLNEQSLRINLEILRLIQDKADIKIICALKGFSFWYTFPMIANYLSGATASSLNEARLIVEEMGCEAHTYCPVYKKEEFDTLLLYSSHLTFNSISQYAYFFPQTKNLPKKVSFGLRINPEYSEVKTDIYNPALEGSRLGIPRHMLGNTLPEGIEGIHFHVLCENNSYTLERTLKIVEAKFGDLIRQAKWINMGGGHLITKEGYDVDHLIQILQDFKQRYPNLKEIILEPGEAIGWQTGFLVSSIQDIIPQKNFNIAMLDVSFSCHMPDCLEMPYKPSILQAHNPKPGDKFIYRMGGCSCLAGDFMGMGDYAFDEPLECNERIIFEDMIHYTMVKTTFFNGIQHPNICVWTENDEVLILRNFDYEDYKNKLS
ncbi:MAG: carboxynorspermidine decarboxylase [Bacteroidales bacterium]|jgi:carboxynorspermidine decarboxylase|nr:carboxynorspermidine decarboxylase [Bacteroidales bacterium]MDD3330043.1 carboxynorspermidine decarboxylase [Bacteroidales bacterium]